MTSELPIAKFHIVDKIEIEDSRTWRRVVIHRPLDEYMTGSQLQTLESAVRAWGEPASTDNAEQTIHQLANGRPTRILYGLLWLTGLWCSISSTRLDVVRGEFVDNLTYTGRIRPPSGMSRQHWNTLEQIIRRGVHAVLKPDNGEDAREFLRITSSVDPSLRRIRFTLLALMDGLSQDMTKADLMPWGLATHITTAAGWA